ncbi:ATP:cob(I)alamin adenosyltransferase [Candidatus Fermentibacteria bacterium]|nr:ATP:cob(I)alamin adenosyltransferase [Candidatus Fermentibacteria bacterium]
MPLTTKTGDEGWTRDGGSRRVRKDDVLIEAYGVLDELQCHLWWLAAVCPSHVAAMVARWHGVVTAAAETVWGRSPEVDSAMVRSLEDDIAAVLPDPPAGFVTPGGSEASSRAHLARVVCRTAERRVVAAMGIGAPALPVLNRLSDALFALAVALGESGMESRSSQCRGSK